VVDSGTSQVEISRRHRGIALPIGDSTNFAYKNEFFGSSWKPKRSRVFEIWSSFRAEKNNTKGTILSPRLRSDHPGHLESHHARVFSQLTPEFFHQTISMLFKGFSRWPWHIEKLLGLAGGDVVSNVAYKAFFLEDNNTKEQY